MRGTLYVVATPIGNLEDITLRALRILGEVDLILAEDTRWTAKLLTHFGVKTRTTSLHEHNEASRLRGVLDRLASGSRVALVSDAGTPTVSDPGRRLVGAVLEAGYRVEPIPGVSAVLTALSCSGLPGDSFTFAGFVPRRSKDRNRWLAAIGAQPHTVIFFESPHRLRQTLKVIRESLGNRQIIVARELTKVYEELVIGPTDDVLERLMKPRGEFTILLPPAPQAPGSPKPPPEPEDLRAEFCQMTETLGLTRRQAIQELARLHDQGTKTIFATLETAKNRSKDR